MTLTLTLMTLMTMYLVRGKNFAAETETYASVQRSANQLLRRISNDIYHSSAKNNQITTNTVIFLSFAPTDSSDPELELEADSGLIMWKKWVSYYYEAGQTTLFRAELPLTTPTSDLTTAPGPSMDAVIVRTQPDVVRRPLATNVTDFNISGTPKMLKVRLTTQGDSPVASVSDAQRRVSVTVETEISIVN